MMGDELVRLCDSIEHHGLVDYEYGVWEEQVIESALPLSLHERVFVMFTNLAFAALEECLDISTSPDTDRTLVE